MCVFFLEESVEVTDAGVNGTGELEKLPAGFERKFQLNVLSHSNGFFDEAWWESICQPSHIEHQYLFYLCGSNLSLCEYNSLQCYLSRADLSLQCDLNY